MRNPRKCWRTSIYFGYRKKEEKYGTSDVFDCHCHIRIDKEVGVSYGRLSQYSSVSTRIGQTDKSVNRLPNTQKWVLNTSGLITIWVYILEWIQHALQFSRFVISRRHCCGMDMDYLKVDRISLKLKEGRRSPKVSLSLPFFRPTRFMGVGKCLPFTRKFILSLAHKSLMKKSQQGWTSPIHQWRYLNSLSVWTEQHRIPVLI